MRSLIVILIAAITLCSQAQNQVILSESFDNNSNSWKLINDQFVRGSISGSAYRIQNNGQDGESVTQYLNRLDTRKDFKVEATISAVKPGSQYGITWGAVNHKDAYFFIVKGFNYALFETNKGMVSVIKDMTRTIKSKPTTNRMRVEKKGREMTFYLNDFKVHEFDINQVKGNAFGFNIWGNSSITVDEFTVTGTELPINEAPNLYYTEKPINLGPTVNSKYDEMTPVIAPNGKGLYFSRAYDPKNSGGPSDYQDAYFSQSNNGEWGTPVNLGAPINNSSPNAVHAVTPDGNTLLLMNTYASDGRAKGMGMSVSKRTSEGWSMPSDIKMRQFYNSSRFNEFFLSNDGMVILMAVERQGGEGSRDIYVSFNEGNGIWSAPKNIGPVVNTPGTELSPFLASDGKTLYFSSNGHPGYGKNDVFITKRLDNSWRKWSTPMNVGKPINGPGRNAYYSVPASGDYAYFISDEGSLGKGDIFKVKLPSAVKPEPIVLVTGKVLNKRTRKPIGTTITVHDLSTGKEVGVASSSPVDGSYEIVLPPGKTYSFYAVEDGFYSVREVQEVKQTQELYEEIERDLYLTPFEVGEPMQMHNVFFVQSEAKLKSGSFDELDKLVALMKEHNTMRIELGGHTDNQGNADLNVDLSKRRVETVKQYLVEKGINPSRIDGKGYGGSKPAYPNTQEYWRQKNRRVEFTILSF